MELSDIDDVLCIDFVQWNRVNAYMNELDRVLVEILSLGKTAPAKALDLIWYFIKTIPNIFNSVHDEYELGMLCSELAQAAWSLTKKAAWPVQDAVRRLLDAYAADVHDTCRFDEIPGILATTRMNNRMRHEMAEVALNVAQSHPKATSELRALADNLLATVGKKGKGT